MTVTGGPQAEMGWHVFSHTNAFCPLSDHGGTWEATPCKRQALSFARPTLSDCAQLAQMLHRPLMLPMVSHPLLLPVSKQPRPHPQLLHSLKIIYAQKVQP